MIELIDISKKFNAGTVNETVLFENFNFKVDKGDFVSVIGSNGSGKTTLLNLVAGTVLQDEGSVLLDNSDITFKKEFIRAKRMGRVFQDPSRGVASNMTIAENMSLADNKGKLYGLSSGLSKKRISYYRELIAPIGLGLEDKMEVKMGALSGGQRQAVALIMATMTPVDILILDEHTAALDPKTADIIMDLTNKVIKEKELTALMVTHNLRYAVEYGNRMVMMHEGKCVLDVKGEDKKNTSVNDVLGLFNSISIECGN